MNRTSNYNLCQWARSDKVQMEDFNADNTKIDSALTGLQSALTGEADARKALDAALRPKAGAQLIKDVTLTWTSSSVHIIPASGINWNDWFMVLISIEIITPPGSYSTMYFYVNDKPISELNYYSSEQSADKVMPTAFLFYPFFDERYPVQPWPVNHHAPVPTGNLPFRFRDITQFKMGPGGTVGAGTRYKIWGFR